MSVSNEEWDNIVRANGGFAPPDQLIGSPPRLSTIYGTIPVPSAFRVLDIVHLTIRSNPDRVDARVVDLLRPYFGGA